jgi:hypothetical protein
MFYGHPGSSKNGMVMLTWALSAVATGTGFYLVNQENALSTTDKGYLIAAATLAAVALFFLTGIATDYLVDVINMREYHIHGMLLAWGCLVAAMGIWWWVYNTRLVDRDDQWLLTSAITTTIAVAFLTGSVLLERGEKIPVLDKVERTMRRVGNSVTPGRKSSKKASPKKKSPAKRKKSPSKRK